MFGQFLGDECNFESLNKTELNNKLRLVYASINKSDGEHLKVSSLHSMKYGLSKHFKSKCDIDIQTDVVFESSKVFKAVVTDLKRKWFGGVDHKPPIAIQDLKKLYDINQPFKVFDIETPVGLQRKVFFDIMFYLCRRGRENLREMSKATFAVGYDAEGLQFIHQVKDEADKNHGFVHFNCVNKKECFLPQIEFLIRKV